MGEAVVLAGTVDERELASLTATIRAEEPDAFADYVTIGELSHLAHLSRNRIRHALTHAKLRPMRGIKRGPLWFVNRIEALRWAHVISEFEAHKWQANTKRINRMLFREERGIPAPRTPAPRYQYSLPPEGLRVYTVAAAAAVLEITAATCELYLAPSGPLRHVERYRLADRTKVVNAEQIDERKRTVLKPNPDDRRLRKNRDLSVVRERGVA